MNLQGAPRPSWPGGVAARSRKAAEQPKPRRRGGGSTNVLASCPDSFCSIHLWLKDGEIRLSESDIGRGGDDIRPLGRTTCHHQRHAQRRYADDVILRGELIAF